MKKYKKNFSGLIEMLKDYPDLKVHEVLPRIQFKMAINENDNCKRMETAEGEILAGFCVFFHRWFPVVGDNPTVFGRRMLKDGEGLYPSCWRGCTLRRKMLFHINNTKDENGLLLQECYKLFEKTTDGFESFEDCFFYLRRLGYDVITTPPRIISVCRSAVDFLYRNRHEKVSDILSEVAVYRKQGRSTDNYVFDSDEVVIGIYCGYLKRWCPIIGPNAVEFRKTNSFTGYKTSSTIGLNRSGSFKARRSKFKERLFDDVLTKGKSLKRAEAELLEFLDVESKIKKEEIGFATRQELVDYLNTLK